jgi:hypothetical protein
MKPDLALFNGRFGEIIAERIAGVAPEQRADIARRTIIEILMTRPEVPLIGLLRRDVAMELEKVWLPKRERQKVCRQRRLEFIESVYFLAKYGRKNKTWAKAGKPQPQSTSLEAVADYFGFPSPEALAQFLKRERQARKKPRP